MLAIVHRLPIIDGCIRGGKCHEQVSRVRVVLARFFARSVYSD
jgi:hypothetical protein